MPLETRRASVWSFMIRNGMTTGNVERNTRRNTPVAPSQSRLRRSARLGGSGSAFNRSRIASSSAGCRTEATDRRQRPGEGPLRLPRIGALAHGVPDHELSRRLIQTTHQVEHPVDHSPGQIAPESAEEHGADLGPARLGDAEDPVKVRTMIRPKRTSEMRSIGSSTRLEDPSAVSHGSVPPACFAPIRPSPIIPSCMACSCSGIEDRERAAKHRRGLGFRTSGRQQVERHGEDQVDHQQ